MRKLVGFDKFVRHNPLTDKFPIQNFHHLEYFCSDASNVAKRFGWGLGMQLVAKSDLSTGNKEYASYAMQSGHITFIFTAPYNAQDTQNSVTPHPQFQKDSANKFIIDHGLAVKAIGIRVDDAAAAYRTSVANGAMGVLEPQTLVDQATGRSLVISEIKMYGDVVIRWLSGDFEGSALPNYEHCAPSGATIGLLRVDHVVSNVPKLFEAVDYLINSVGLHEFSEFTAEDIGTVDSGLNSMVLASNNEFVLMPVNEPTFGTKRKSQIQTFLEANNGAGVQHIALLTSDIFKTMSEMRKRTDFGGFDFMPPPGPEYYAKVPGRIGEKTLTAEQLTQLEALGLLADKDDQGVLLQVFTRPVGDRPTLFLEIIQRIGCDRTPEGQPKPQTAGCGGFGKGNFSELFKSIEDFEKQQEAAAAKHFTGAVATQGVSSPSKKARN